MIRKRCIDVRYHVETSVAARKAIEQRLSVVGNIGNGNATDFLAVVHVGCSGHIGYGSSLDFYIDDASDVNARLLAEINAYFLTCESHVLLYLGKFPSGGQDLDGGSQLACQLIDTLKCRCYLDVCFIRKINQEYSDDVVHTVSYVPYIDPFGNKFERRLKNLESNSVAIRNGNVYDVIVTAHCSKFFGLSHDAELMHQAVLFPMFLTKSYERAGEHVPDQYTEMERSVLTSVSSIITPSQDEMDDIVTGYGVDPSKITIVPRGIDPQIHMTAHARNEIRLISVGSIKKQKNHLCEIAVLARLHQLGFKAKLTIIGNTYDEAERSALWNVVSRSQLDEDINIVSGLNRQDIAHALESHNFGISTSRWETFGRGIFECLASGLPTILASSLKTVRDYLQGNAGAFFCESIEEMADEIVRLFLDPLAYEAASVAASSIAIRFSSRIEAERLLYSILLDRIGYRSRFTSWWGLDTVRIYDGRYSFCLKLEGRVRKYIRFDNQLQVEREFDIAKMAFEAGVNTPRPYYTGWDCRYGLFYIEFEYLGGEEITRYSERDCADILKAIDVVQSFSARFPVVADMTNFRDAIKACDEHFAWSVPDDMRYLESLTPEVLVHGDLWSQNMRRGKDGRIIIYDFQSAAIGPRDWDWCYVLANSRPTSFPIGVVRRAMNPYCKGLINLIHKIRIGRALCKHLPIDELLDIMRTWELAYNA